MEHRSAEYGLRFDSSWGLRIFPLSHARDKTKNIFMELKTYTLFTLGLYKFGKKKRTGSTNGWVKHLRRIRADYHNLMLYKSALKNLHNNVLSHRDL